MNMWCRKTVCLACCTLEYKFRRYPPQPRCISFYAVYLVLTLCAGMNDVAPRGEWNMKHRTICKHRTILHTNTWQALRCNEHSLTLPHSLFSYTYICISLAHATASRMLLLGVNIRQEFLYYSTDQKWYGEIFSEKYFLIKNHWHLFRIGFVSTSFVELYLP